MDPLSIIASVVTLIAATNAAGRGLQKLVGLRGAPDIMVTLNNDVADIQLLLNEVNVLLREASSLDCSKDGSDRPRRAGFQALEPVLQRIREKLSELDEILDRLPASNLNFVSRMQWLKVESRVLRLHNELRSLKTNLDTALGLLTSNTALRLQVELRNLHIATTRGQLGVSKAIADRFSDLQESLETSLSTHGDREEGFKRLETQMIALSDLVKQQQNPLLTDSEKHPGSTTTLPGRTRALGGRH